MANITFTAVGARGHIGYYDLPARSSVVLDLINASYNSVKVYPAQIYIQNGSNNSGIAVTDDAGITQTIHARVNHVIDVGGQRQFRAVNSGKAACRLIIIDDHAAAGNYANLALSDNVDATSINDVLMHFDDSANVFANSGAELFTIAGSATFTGTASAKYGLGCASVGTVSAAITLNSAGFFNMSQDFTLDAWVSMSATLGQRRIINFGNTASPNEIMMVFDAVAPPCNISFVGAGGVTGGTTGNPFLAGQYNFLRIVKNGNSWQLWINGVLGMTAASTYAAALAYLTVGAGPANSGFTGFVDELRYSKGYVPDNPGEVPTGQYI